MIGIDYAAEALDLFEKHLLQNLEFVGSHLNLLFNKGIFAFKMKDIERGSECCEQVLSLCEVLKHKERGKMYANRYKMWKENVDNSNFKEITIEPGILGFTLE